METSRCPVGVPAVVNSATWVKLMSTRMGEGRGGIGSGEGVQGAIQMLGPPSDERRGAGGVVGRRGVVLEVAAPQRADIAQPFPPQPVRGRLDLAAIQWE